jgi:GT2 family glycosyltransferase
MIHVKMGRIGGHSGSRGTSVVVVSHRPTPVFNACLESVISQADEVLVVDNGSADEEASRLARQAGARSRRAASVRYSANAHHA